jgi:hypothetical protein
MSDVTGQRYEAKLLVAAEKCDGRIIFSTAYALTLILGLPKILLRRIFGRGVFCAIRAEAL